jgi:Cu-processing system permease protein
MIDFGAIRTIAMKDLREALRNRWFLLYTLIFGGLALVLSLLSQPDFEYTETAGYSRTVTSLVNLVLLFVPLIGLTFGAMSIASERETRAINYLLAQPLTPVEILLGKYLGMALALIGSLSLGFGAAGIVLALNGGHDVTGYALTILLAVFLGLAMLSVGFLISSLTHKTATALGGALFLWLLLVFIGDLGLIGAAVVTQMPTETTLIIALVNPLQAFKMGSIYTVEASLDVLGPAGLYATDTFDHAFLPLMFILLALWILVPLGLSLLAFIRQTDAA